MFLESGWGNKKTRLRCLKCAPLETMRKSFNLVMSFPGISSQCNYNVINGMVNTVHKDMMPMRNHIACFCDKTFFFSPTIHIWFPSRLLTKLRISHTTGRAERLSCKVPSLEREHTKQQTIRWHHGTTMPLYKPIRVKPYITISLFLSLVRVFPHRYFVQRDIYSLSNLIRMS